MTGVDMAAYREGGVHRMSADDRIMDLGYAKSWLAAIVDNSFDAILSKTLDGIIISWNAGAERLFGYSEAEAVGQPITIIIPDDRLSEEADIIARLRRGERIGWFETIRHRKDRTPIEVELTISPVRNGAGEIIGASKIARDIGERKRQAEAQGLLLREMSHRIKNLLSVIQALIRLGRREDDVETFSEDLSGRLSALARAHDLILERSAAEHGKAKTTLDKLLHVILTPYLTAGRIAIDVPAERLGRQAVTSLALVFHELATNAVKYGGLSADAGRLSIQGNREGDHLLLHWREEGGKTPDHQQEGFGTTLVRASLQSLGGSIEQHWRQGAFELELRLSADRLAA